MSAMLRSLRKLLLGETWSIPLGVAAALGAALLARKGLAPDAWAQLGGFILAGGVGVALAVGLRIGR